VPKPAPHSRWRRKSFSDNDLRSREKRVRDFQRFWITHHSGEETSHKPGDFFTKPAPKDSPANGTSSTIIELMSGTRVACSLPPIRGT
jgi:hypothetical protein